MQGAHMRDDQYPGSEQPSDVLEDNKMEGEKP